MKTFYMVIDKSDVFELPVMLSDKVSEVASWLGLTLGSAYCAISRHTTVGCRYQIEKVRVPREEIT